MQLTEISYSDVVPVDGYGPGFFRIGGQVLKGRLLVTPESAGPWGGFEDEAALLALAGQVDVLLVGTGETLLPVPANLLRRLEAAGLGVETMASPPACRTYNVLLAEGRRVALALFPL